MLGTSTTSSASVASKSFPSAGVRLAWGEMTWKFLETARDGRPGRSGQLAVPASSSVHVIGSPTAAVSGTTFEVSLRSPTAPLKPDGAAGSGFTARTGVALVTEYC